MARVVPASLSSLVCERESSNQVAFAPLLRRTASGELKPQPEWDEETDGAELKRAMDVEDEQAASKQLEMQGSAWELSGRLWFALVLCMRPLPFFELTLLSP